MSAREGRRGERRRERSEGLRTVHLSRSEGKLWTSFTEGFISHSAATSQSSALRNIWTEIKVKWTSGYVVLHLKNINEITSHCNFALNALKKGGNYAYAIRQFYPISQLRLITVLALAQGFL